MLKFPLVDSRYCNLVATYAPTFTNNTEKISSFDDQLDQILRAIPNIEKSSFLEILTLVLAYHIIPDRRFLVSLEWGRLIPKSICCYASAQNISRLYKTPSSNTSRFLRIPGWTQEANASAYSTASPHDSGNYPTFWKNVRWEDQTAVRTMLWSSTQPNNKLDGEWEKIKC